jgi:hypothetical protein
MIKKNPIIKPPLVAEDDPIKDYDDDWGGSPRKVVPEYSEENDDYTWGGHPGPRWGEDE